MWAAAAAAAAAGVCGERRQATDSVIFVARSWAVE